MSFFSFHKSLPSARHAQNPIQQLLSVEYFTCNSHALANLGGEVCIAKKTRILQVGGGVPMSRFLPTRPILERRSPIQLASPCALR